MSIWRSHIHKGLRFRLAVSYAIFFALLLTGFGFLLRGMLSNVIENVVQGVLDEEWAAMKGFLHVSPRGELDWDFDPNDKEEMAIVERLRATYLIANDKGEVIESSEAYREIGFESPATIARTVADGKPSYAFRTNLRGQRYMVRHGVIREKGKRFFVSIGRSFQPSMHVLDDFTVDYFAALPLIILTATALGWLLAGRALQPVGEVAHELAKVSGSNLSLRVPLRGSGDELDLMINSFNSMVSRLETSFQQIRQFSTDVSHELRTPITVVRGQLEVALMTSRSEEDLRAAIENALPDFDRLSAIVRALLQLAKAESGQLQLQMADVDLAALVREVMDELDLPAMDKQITLHHLVPPTVVISGDRIQLERLLYNLIDNAIKYTPSGGEIDVSVNTIPEDAYVQLIVRDNGVGIAPEHLPHLFDRFYRVPDKEGSIEKGLGLGLSFVSWIVKAHNGKIDVESEVGKGTVFTVSFPWAPAESKSLIEHGNQRETAGRSLYS